MNEDGVIKKRESIEYLSQMKGIVIILVVVGHACIEAVRENSQFVMWLYSAIYSFHMPFFVCISGILFADNWWKYKESGYKTFFIKKAKRLLIPYLAVTTIGYIIACLVSIVLPKLAEKIIGRISLKGFINAVLLCENNVCEHLWFIYVLLLVQIIAFLLYSHRMCGKKTIICLYLISLISAYVNGSIFRFPGVLVRVPQYLFWFILGPLLWKHKDKLWMKTLGILWGAEVLFSTISLDGLLILRNVGSIFNDKLYAYTFTHINELILSLGGFVVVYFFTKEIKNNNFCNRKLTYIGNKSMIIYLYHHPYITVGTVFVLNTIKVYSGVAILVGTILGVGIPLLLSDLLKRKR